MVGPIR